MARVPRPLTLKVTIVNFARDAENYLLFEAETDACEQHHALELNAARSWLMQTNPETNEEKVYQL